jgi:hypothetical protein
MNRVTIRRFDVVRTATVAAALYALIAIVFGLLFFLPFGLLAGVAGMRTDSGAGGAGLVGVGIVGTLVFVLFGVVFYGVVGWVMTAIMCALYNFVAGRVGGIRVEVDVEGPYGGGPGYPAPGYPAAYPAPGYGTPAWPVPGSPGGPTAPPPGWGQPG